ncbi:MAG TPA: SUF system NifU family Fe-S cluster assembly protein [Oligoflexia bacterium]|nr:SUF system NifU family Fe-S cluster assembly protein [Oligoflexia bacterium]HMP48322.1 SUF system NifU family Fe-S cluster assembly protein [Oligoflexia bacterium]
MSSLLELYQETIIDHSRSPRKYGRLPSPTISTSAKNPLCGDKIIIDVDLQDNTIKDIACESSGCAISTAAASIMTEELSGKSLKDAIEICEKFIDSLKTGDDNFSDSEQLKVFCKVSEYPTRVKCAALPWQSILQSLKNMLP